MLKERAADCLPDGSKGARDEPTVMPKKKASFMLALRRQE
jgi:hypothetical protein